MFDCSTVTKLVSFELPVSAHPGEGREHKDMISPPLCYPPLLSSPSPCSPPHKLLFALSFPVAPLNPAAMSRLAPTPRAQLPPDQQSAYDEITEIATSSFGSAFKFKDAHDAFIGPFPCFLAQSAIGVEGMNYFAHFSKMPGLPADARETAILAVGAMFKAPYELYAHGNVAVKKVGMDAGVVKEICEGSRPEALSAECRVAYDVAKYLAGTPGPLEKGLWERGVEAFGKEGMIALVHYIG